MTLAISESFQGSTAISFQEPTAIVGHEALFSDCRESPDLIVKELQHRIRNLLSVVQCFVSNTQGDSTEDYRTALSARIATLSDGYALIEKAHENRISLARLVVQTLKPHAALSNDSILVAGPDVILEPRFALSLHMIFYELATNSMKYGALTSSFGTVEVLWDVFVEEGSRILAVQWRERGGPEVRKPRREGFGMRLISRALSGAKVDMDFAPAGLICRVMVAIDPSAVL